MPTKRNKAGNMQPYVPAGYGDESGEYRENAYGLTSQTMESENIAKQNLKEFYNEANAYLENGVEVPDYIANTINNIKKRFKELKYD